MKKIIVLIAVCSAMLCSCNVMRTNVKFADVNAPVLSTTVASLEVESEPITFVYEPTKVERKHLSTADLIKNAQFLALQQHGSGDVMVQVSYKLEIKKFFFFVRVKKVTITGYPATYKNFRNPNEEDRKNIDTFYNEKIDNNIQIVEKKRGLGL